MTKEKAREAAQVMLAWADGKEVECKYPYGWDKVDMPNWDWLAFTYRIKPTATLRPWTPDEVPLGAWMRSRQGIWRSLIVAVDSNGKIIVHYRGIEREDGLEHYEHSLDGGKTWLPCGVVEEAK